MATSILGVGILVALVLKSYIELRQAKEVSVDQQLHAELKDIKTKLEKDLLKLESTVSTDMKIIEDKVKSIEARNSMTELSRTVRPR
jgi:sensor domain CHASE-containing protein